MNKVEAIDWQLERERKKFLQLEDLLRTQAEHIRYLEGARRHALSDTTVFSGSDARCSGCGADVSTERLFSEHYVITDPRYYNLGECPNKKRG